MPTATPTRVSDFFLRLGDDLELLGAFQRDPAGAMAYAGLTREEISTVLDGPPERVRKTVDGELLADPVRRRRIVLPRMVVHMPPPDGPTGPTGPTKPKSKPKRRVLA